MGTKLEADISRIKNNCPKTNMAMLHMRADHSDNADYNTFVTQLSESGVEALPVRKVRTKITM